MKSSFPKPIESFLLSLSALLKASPRFLEVSQQVLVRVLPPLALLAAFVYSVSSYWNILPGIFQDEYVYSMGARKIPLAEQSYPNYLFSIIFQSTSICGDDFYQCGKAINTTLLIVLLFVFYLLSRTVLSRSLSTWLSAVVAISPTTVFASFFMPEILFYTINLLVILLLVRGVGPGSGVLPLVTLLLTLAFLTKRHELFLLPGYALAIFLLLRSHGMKTLAALATGLTFSVVFPVGLRQLVVFGLTGDRFAPLLGSTYGSSFRESTSEGASAASEGADVFELLSQGLWHLVFHLVFLLLIGLAFVRWRSREKTLLPLETSRKTNQSSRLETVSLSLALSIVPIVVFFESYLTLIGDSHSFRLLPRYYEFLVLVLLIIASRRLDKNSLEVRGKSILVSYGAAVIGFVLLIGPFIQTGISDSPTIHGMKLLGPLILAYLVLAAWLFFSKRAWARKSLILSLMVPSIVVASGLAVRLNLGETVGVSYSYFDIAGIEFSNNFPDAVGEEVLVIGSSRTEVTATKFWIDKPGIRHAFQTTERKEIKQSKLDGIRYAITLAPTSLSTSVAHVFLLEGEGYRVYEIVEPK